MRRGRLALPRDLVRRLQAFQRRAERGRRRVDGERRVIDAAEFLGARMHMHQLHLRLGNIEQRVALRRHLAQAPADQQHQIGALHARQQFRIGPDAHIAGVTGMQPVEQILAAEGGRDRQREALGKAHQRGAGGSDQRLPPTSATGRLAAHNSFCSRLMSVRPGQISTGSNGARIRHHGALDQHVLRHRDHHRPGPAVAGGVEGARDQFRNARGIVDLGRPFGDRAEHRAVVEFLERLALAHMAPDLADEHDHRRGILARDVDAGRGVGGARPARDEADAGAAGGLADRLGHHGGAALVPADGERDFAIVKRVERGQIALARHAEHVAHPVDRQLIDQDFAAGPRAVIAAHRSAPT